MRKSIAGINLQPIGQELLAQAEMNHDDANLWMNLSIVMQCIGLRDIGLTIQAQALALKNIYHIPATGLPGVLRLLVLVSPGDLAENTPIECLLENSDIDLTFYYISNTELAAAPVPDHDVLMVGMSESAINNDLLNDLATTLANWHVPVINAPQYLKHTRRDTASTLLQNIPGLCIPPTIPVSRNELLEIADGHNSRSGHTESFVFPIILRPTNSQAGRDLAKMNSASAIHDYLAHVPDTSFYLSRFIDYSSNDGLFRKFRIVMIDGTALPVHMAVSSHWMVHYLNAGMYEDAEKRKEEADFMNHFDAFHTRHQHVLQAIHNRLGLDYFCIDCAETRDGEFLVFETDHIMVIHSMDPETLFPYKHTHVKKIQDTFKNFLFRRIALYQQQSVPFTDK